MHLDPTLPALVGATFAVLVAGLILQRLGQPQIVAYLLAGIAIGPHGFGIVSDIALIRQLGDAGVVLLLFFVGMEISLPHLLSNWRVPILGTLAQIAASVAAVVLVGSWLGWPLSRSVLLGFVISLSSTAIVIRLLHDSGEADTRVGRDVVGVLLAQDMALVPMLIVVSHMAGRQVEEASPILQGIGVIALLVIFGFLAKERELRVPLSSVLRRDRELQVFAAFAICFGMATLTGALGLSTAVGAFAGGIVVAAAKETRWVRQSLDPFRVLLVAFFFVSVGMLLDLAFLRENLVIVLALAALALLTNTVINVLIFRVLRRSWEDSWYGGALLSQIGELSFVLAAVGLTGHVITDYAYRMTIAIIALTMLVSPAWIVAVRHLRAR